MTKKKRTRKSQPKKSRKPAPRRNDPWLSQRTGLIVMGLLSVGLAGYMTWQLLPTEGTLAALAYGVGFAVAIWLIFGLALAFNIWVRRR